MNKTNLSKSSNGTSNLNHAPTIRSRNSIIKGSKAFVWDNEEVRTDLPYWDKRYHIPFNPPPNEINFIGGIGKKSGNFRSKLHPNRPTIIQQVYGMKNRNKIEIGFTQSAKDMNCIVPARPNKATKMSASQKSLPTKLIEKFVNKVSLADMIPSSSSASSRSSDEILASQKKSSLPTSDKCSDEQLIDGKPFYYDREKINKRVKDFMTKQLKNEIKVPPILPKDEDQFRDWAHIERKKYKDSRIGPALSDTTISSDDQVSLLSVVRSLNSVTRRQSQKNHKNVEKHIAGYMYGPFTELAEPDELMNNENKFGIPKSMTERAKRYYKKRKIQDNVIRRFRMSHMGFQQPPTKSADYNDDVDVDSSEENESIQNVKRLALIRTPYFIVPTVKMTQVKRSNRFRNNYLKRDRLKRINLLFDDRSKSRSIRENLTDEEYIKQKQSIFAKFFQLKGKKVKPIEPIRDPNKQKYYQLIKQKYEEFRKQCEAIEEVKQPITFEEYKNGKYIYQELNTMSERESGVDGVSDKIKTSRSIDLSKKKLLQLSEPKKLFERKKHERLSKMDDLFGPFYLDPNLMDKLRAPKSLRMYHKYYSNLIKGQFALRDRLQVNTPSFLEEKIGARKKYYHRLATEWDEYYINELRHRPPIKKFCVKTDILRIREIVRNNYIMYYIQENLLDLQAKQREEKQLMDNVEKFQKLCERIFSEWKAKAFDGVEKSHHELKVLQLENNEFIIKKHNLNDEFAKVNKNIYELEQRWNFLLKIQNYYYLVQSVEWRNEFDWIHRENDNILQSELIAVKFCGIRNIRPQTDCLGYSIKEFYDNRINPILDKMRTIKPEAKLLNEGMKVLKVKTITGIIQHNKTFWVYKQIHAIFNKLMGELSNFNKNQEDQLVLMKEKKEFIVNRNELIKKKANDIINKMLPKTAYSPMERKILAICSEMYKVVMPSELNIAKDDLIGSVTSLDKFRAIHKYTMSLLIKVDEIPLEIQRICEHNTRETRKIITEESKQAMIKQKRYDLMNRQIRNHFSVTAKFKRISVWRKKVIDADTQATNSSN